MNKTFNQSTSNGRKRKFTPKLRGLAMLFGGLALAAGNTFAEGTKEIANNNATTNSALLIYQSRGTGPFLNNISENRIRIRIADFNTERIYFGFKWRDYGTTSSAGDEIGANVWAVIYDPSGTEVKRQRFNSTTNGYISTFDKAVNGPNILGISNGYAPLSFTPAMNGEYAMVFYRVTGNGTDQTAVASNASQEFKASFWDITVANASERLNGRVFSQNWGLLAITSSERVNAMAKAAPSFYAYSNDSTLIKLSFASATSGLAPIAYDIAFTDYGVSNSLTDWSQSRRSVQSGTSNMVMTGGFKTFLNAPSAALYPIAQINGTPAFAAVPVTGCPGGQLTANFTLPEPGDVRIVFDIDGNGDGYTPNTRDFVLEAFDRPQGAGSITWNGKDGQGNDLVAGTAISISATYRRGRFNLPIYDAEVNADGIYIQTIAPLSSPSNRLYWDDSGIPAAATSGVCSDNDANVTGTGLNNSLFGTVSSAASPTRAWNGNGNLGNVVPAPSVLRGSIPNDNNGAQCDDYGNVRVLNTWGWALEADGQQTNVTFGCFSIAGNVFNDVNGKNNNLIDQSATNPVALPTLYAHLVSSDSVVRAAVAVNANGTYTFTNIPGANYNVVISSTQVSVSSKLNYATQVTLPAGWSNAGEQLGNTANTGIDPIADGILPLVLNGNKTNANFGIQRLPVAGSGTNTAANTGGTAQVTVPGNTFTNTTVSSDYDGGSISGIRILSFPDHVTSMVINGTTYTSSGTWPAAGIGVPAGTSGAPTQTITVDPDFDGPGSVVILFKSVDNAGQASMANGTATLTFGANISGLVWNDFNGDALPNALEKPVSGDRNNINSGNSVAAGADLFASITGADNLVRAAVRVNADGTYAFTNLGTGVAYKVILTSGTAAPLVNSLLTAGSNAAGWVATGVKVNGTATTVNTTNIVNLGVVNENKEHTDFGIQRTPTADAKSYAVSNSAFNNNAPAGTLSGYPAVTGYAYLQMSDAAVGSLTGTDAEDCPAASSCAAGSSFSIQSINGRTKLYYNFGGTTGVREVVPGTATGRIDNFNPAHMLIYAQSGGGTAATPFAFTYSIIDKANATSPAMNYVITTTTPLPVSLTGFTATANDRNVTLTWSTLFERNNKGFAIERSFDARSWQEVIFEASKAINGSSNEKLDYVVIDKSVAPGTIYYRLKQSDHDGVSWLSDVRMVNIRNSGLSIYPNPATHSASILGLAARHTVIVYDVTGSVMMTAEVNAHNNTINIASLTPGVYTVVIKNESGAAGTFKLVKE